jgi:hypothetical protein
MVIAILVKEFHRLIGCKYVLVQLVYSDIVMISVSSSHTLVPSGIESW